MSVQVKPSIDISANLLDAIRSFPLEREVEHCGQRWTVSSLEIYSTCPHCQVRLKLRSFAAVPEIEDVFDAVLEWLNQPGSEDLAKQRQDQIQADAD